jgi:hypothetical protein
MIPDLRVYGGTKQQKEATKRCVSYCANKLLSKQMLNNIRIDVHLKNWKGRVLYGQCWYEDCNIRPRHFKINVNRNLHSSLFLSTLCHEMIHVRQYAKGQIRDRYKPEYHTQWVKEDLTPSHFHHKDKVVYSINAAQRTFGEKEPWEAEAKLLEWELFSSMIEDGVCDNVHWRNGNG